MIDMHLAGVAPADDAQKSRLMKVECLDRRRIRRTGTRMINFCAVSSARSRASAISSEIRY